MPGWMMGDGMMDNAMMADMGVIMALLTDHDQIRRDVVDVDGGIRSVTTSADARLAGLIRTHVAAMRARIENNRPIRHGDPLFAEIFEHHAAVSIDTADLPDGIQVTETSTDPRVELLIGQHAHRAVSEFVASGMGPRDAAHIPAGRLSRLRTAAFVTQSVPTMGSVQQPSAHPPASAAGPPARAAPCAYP